MVRDRRGSWLYKFHPNIFHPTHVGIEKWMSNDDDEGDEDHKKEEETNDNVGMI